MPTSLGAIQAELSQSPKSAAPRFWAIIEWAKAQADEGIDAIGVDSLIQKANALYDSYVAPFDVPWVPDIIEPTLIDAPAKQLLAALICNFAAWVDDDKTPILEPRTPAGSEHPN